MYCGRWMINLKNLPTVYKYYIIVSISFYILTGLLCTVYLNFKPI